jgi:hypothetical protein
MPRRNRRALIASDRLVRSVNIIAGITRVTIPNEEARESGPAGLWQVIGLIEQEI